MKTCENCKYFTGVFCHGHGEYWGECKKNKNTLFCYKETPCLQDIKTLRDLYYTQKQEINKLEYENQMYKIYKLRYEIKCRHLEKVRTLYMKAEHYIQKDKYKEYLKEKIKILSREK